MEFAEFRECSRCLGPEVEELLRVLTQYLAGVGEGAIPRGTFQKNLTQFSLQLCDGLAYRWLSSVKARSSAREASLFCDGEECLQLKEIHHPAFRARESGRGAKPGRMGVVCCMFDLP